MLSERSKQVRRDTFKLSMANGGYHYGGCFSAVEILIALFDHVLTSEDRFILSKGHACWPYYVLLKEMGYDPLLEGHPTRDPHEGVECTTGSEGHGLPTAVGMALARKLKKEGGRIFVLMGDGECQEGTTWESLLLAAHHRLDNLVAIVDWNGIQGSGFVDEILPIPGLDEIAKTIGWDVCIVDDGHNIAGLRAMLNGCGTEQPQPKLILAKTIKGRGVSFMENQPEWHARWPNKAELALALEELKP